MDEQIGLRTGRVEGCVEDNRERKEVDEVNDICRLGKHKCESERVNRKKLWRVLDKYKAAWAIQPRYDSSKVYVKCKYISARLMSIL